MEEPFYTQTLANYLSREFKRLKDKNPRFSLRSFARFLGISPSFLSHLLNRKKKLSVGSARQIAKKLGQNGAETELFCLLAQFELADPDIQPLIRNKINAVTTRLGAKRSRPRGELSRVGWAHLLFLVCVEIRPQIENDALAAFAKFTRLEIGRVKEIAAQLISAGLLEREEGNRYRTTHRQLVLESSTSSQTLQKMHRDYLTRASDLVLQRGPDRRFSVTEFFAIPISRYAEIQGKLVGLLDEISSYSIEPKTDGVLELSLHLNFFSEADIFNPESAARRPGSESGK